MASQGILVSSRYKLTLQAMVSTHSTSAMLRDLDLIISQLENGSLDENGFFGRRIQRRELQGLNSCRPPVLNLQRSGDQQCKGIHAKVAAVL